MSDSKFKRRLHFNRRQYDEILQRMEARCGPPAGGDNRGRQRFSYNVADIPLTVRHPEGGTSFFLAFGRNISRSGLSLLHGGYIHPGSECTVLLACNTGDPMLVTGEVRHCRLFAGSCHEVGIHFNQEIDPAKLLGSEQEQEDEAANTTPVCPITASGLVLVAESFAPDHHLLHHHLSLLGLDIQVAETPGATLDALRRDSIDLVLFGLSLARDGLRTLGHIQQMNLDIPVILLTADVDGAQLQQAYAAGIDTVINKPYNIDLLVAQVRVYLSGTVPLEPSTSTAADQPHMPPLIMHYVELVRRIADQVERTYAEEEIDMLREYCCQLKGSGCSYGFQNVTVAAMSVLNGLQIDPTSEKTREAIDTLLRCCRSLICHVPAA